MKELVHSVKIEKNLLPPVYFKKLKKIVTNFDFPWYFHFNTLYVDKDLKKFPQLVNDHQFMFTHHLCSLDKGPSSNWFKDFEPILYFLDGKIKAKNLLRMKLNLYTNQNKKITHGSHIDINDDAKPRKNVTLSILNFTTCNGGTIISGKKYPSHENEVLIFDNLNKHAGIVQTDTQIRVVLNIALQ